MTKSVTMNIQPAKILSQRSHLVSGKLRITERFFQVPLDHARPDSKPIFLFTRSARKHELPADPDEQQQVAFNASAGQASTTSNASFQQSKSSPSPSEKPLPWLLYLQGGPGQECPSPQSYTFTKSFTEKGYEFLYLDQRGTGLSSPISAATLALQGNTTAQTNYLKHFRADNIVRDAEAIRLALTQDQPEHKKKWSTLGQSFGGFCTTTYLSMFPTSLRECFVFGGLPPLVDQPDEVYRRTFKKVVERNKAYYKKYPEDCERVKQIVRYLKSNTVLLPSGEPLTPRRFLQIGMRLGMHGGIDATHEHVLRATSEVGSIGFLTRRTLDGIAQATPFDNCILYAILHEPLYCQGNASNWSADRILKSTYRGFDPDNTLEIQGQPVYFTGEMIFPFMFEEGAYAELPELRGVANELAAEANWPALYDKKVLARNTVPVYAAVYLDDAYVDFGFSMETAGVIRGCKTYVTNVLYHNAVAARTEQVVEEVWKLRGDTVD